MYVTKFIGHVLQCDLTIAGTMVTFQFVSMSTPAYDRAPKVVAVLLTAAVIHKTLIDILK